MTLLVDAERRYPAAPHQRTHTPGALSPHEAYRDCLRLEFSFTCVYCLSTGSEVGALATYGGFEVEHFKPRSKFRSFRNDYRNLLWACRACDQAKGSTWPKPREVRAGIRFVDPTREALGKYIRIDGEEVVPLGSSLPASYMIDELGLNLPVHRERRKKRAELAEKVGMLEAFATVRREQLERAADTEALKELEAVEKQIQDLMALFRPSRPWDAPTTCACPP